MDYLVILVLLFINLIFVVKEGKNSSTYSYHIAILEHTGTCVWSSFTSIERQLYSKMDKNSVEGSVLYRCDRDHCVDRS